MELLARWSSNLNLGGGHALMGWKGLPSPHCISPLTIRFLEYLTNTLIRQLNANLDKRPGHGTLFPSVSYPEAGTGLWREYENNRSCAHLISIEWERLLKAHVGCRKRMRLEL